MKFKHLLFYTLSALVIVSCSKNSGDNFTFTPPPAADTAGTSSPTAPVSSITLDPSDAKYYPQSGDNNNILFGLPTPATTNFTTSADDYLMNQGYYVESYSKSKAEPNWVSWHLDANDANGTASRSDAFAAFSGLPTGWAEIQSNGYVAATYGFDRGHNCPSADRTSSLTANKATFLMTNMIPQAPNNNQQTWGNFENYLRSLTAQGKEVYIVMGTYGTSGGTGSKGTFLQIGTAPNTVSVPTRIWKVALVLTVGDNDIARVDANTRIISIDTPNINVISSDWKQFIVSMGSIETNGKVSLFSALSPTIHAALAAKIDPGS